MLYLQCTHCMFPHGNGWLQEDNAAPHKSKVAAAFHANKGFLGLLKVQILIRLRIFGLCGQAKPSQAKEKPSNLNELEKCVKRAWKVIPKHMIKNLVDSTPN